MGRSLAQLVYQLHNRKCLLNVLSYAPVTKTIGDKEVISEAVPGIDVAVLVRDLRMAFGRAQALVEPVDGAGSTWVDVNRLTLIEEDGSVQPVDTEGLTLDAEGGALGYDSELLAGERPEDS